MNMNQPKPQLPLWPTPPPAVQRSAVVGGFPWAQPSAEPASPFVVIDSTKTSGKRSGVDGHGENLAPLPLWSAVRARLEWLVRKSPAWTVSLSLHVLLLLLLMIGVVQQKKQEGLRLDMSFSLAQDDQGMEKGIKIEAPPEPEPMTTQDEEKKEEVPEVAATELPPVEQPLATPSVAAPVEDGQAATGTTASLAIGSALMGREPGQKKMLLQAYGGGASTEAAVAMALDWLSRQQGKDGLWSLQGPYDDGGSQENRLAASAMSLMAFQGAGNTVRDGPYRSAVARGWKALLGKQRPEGFFEVGKTPTHHALYSHAQVTIALCELYGMTRDEAFAEPAARAVKYAVEAQGANGAWRYEPGKDGDMSVTGWYVVALQSAQMAGMKVPQSTFDSINSFLELVATDKGTRYGYRRDNMAKQAGPVTASVSAEGLLCRQYLGWAQKDPRLVEGLELLVAENPLDFEKDKDFYAWYYITQVAHHAEGDVWTRWNDRLRDVLPASQVAKGAEKGSWDPSLDKWGHIGGRLYATCFCTFMLEVYYRHMPIYAKPH